ncbi:hypothetical protein [Cryptosporangium aurantiacum]|uniref:Uncharacterized protein n=1 Tax=Cryptosporangium aurantiacum TaxID=134849 RepID=A0A1M7NIG7_9ACTN|nr:hypothetical protein [Cryptosporangium aurantiacum]SHN03499.1 hypothetical protein SAMN05443668_102650 [Cryptosporangium aurantiacum]
MSRRHPPLADSHPQNVEPGHLPSHHFAADPATALAIGGDGTVLGVDPQGAPLSVRLFRPSLTRVVLVGSPRCAQLIGYRALACGAQLTVGTARPQVWTPLVSAATPDPVAVRPFDAEPFTTGRRTRPLLHFDDAPPYGTPPELPAGRWTTVVTIRELLTHREAELLERADLVVLQPLVAAEVDVLASALRAPGADQRLTHLPADVLTVADRRGVRWGRLSVTPIESRYFGPALRR